MPKGFRTSIRAVVITAAITIVLITLHLTNLQPLGLPTWGSARHRTGGLPLRPVEELEPDAPPCQAFNRIDDIVMVMRTGATEIKDKLPAHLASTFQCYPDTLIFSDYAELFEGHEVFDALSIVDEKLKETNSDFEHYRRVQRLGREGLNQDELHGESLESGSVGKNDNPGWRLDKWKFLPMIVRTLELRPQRKWYIFVEPDTYVVWSNMVQWLQTLDPTEDGYFGSEVQIGEDIFAHGGSAFVMSKSAMEKGAEIYLNDPDEWHTRTSQHWAGDCILGTALKHAGVDLTWSWPMFQGGNPEDMNWAERKPERRLWCAPALSYHHFEAPQVKDMWAFEQEHLRELIANAGRSSWFGGWKTVLHHREMYDLYVRPNLTAERPEWTNMSPELITNSAGLSMKQCRIICETKPGCLQFALGPIGCSVSDQVKLGQAQEGVSSGWNLKGIDHWAADLGSCRGRGGWVVGP